MAVSFQDYYAVLGIPRDAKSEDVRRAYLALARKHHPDADKTAGATERFQRIVEAYEVLKDPKTRARYDALGQNWRAGQEFTPPQGFDPARRQRGGTRRTFTDFGGPGGFSAFFESLFGQEDPFDDGPRQGFDRAARARNSGDVEALLHLSLEAALRGGPQTIEFETGEHGGPTRTLEVRIPPGTAAGTTMRLRGQGRMTPEGPGDLLLRVEIAPHPSFEIDGDDVRTVLPIQPHEAALGARASLRTPEGSHVEVTVPAGSSSGKRLRLRGLGLGRRGGSRGDLIVELRIVVPAPLTPEERRLYEELARVSPFQPRDPSSHRTSGPE